MSSVAILTMALLSSGCNAARPAAPSFSAMPVPPGNASSVLGPVTGRGPRTFTISRYASMDYTLGCIGKPMVWLSASNAAFAVKCSAGTFGGEIAKDVKKATGPVTIQVRAAASTRWELRVIGSGRRLG